MNYVVLLAGGSGSRMGQDIPKQFIHVENKPVIVYTLEVLQAHAEIDGIVCVCVDGWEKILAGYAKQFSIDKLQSIVAGGSTRFASTRAGMKALGTVGDDDVIIVHDAVRPLVTADCLSDVIAVCRRNGNSMSVLDCFDTMYSRSGEDYTAQVVERSRLVRGQTPEAVTGRRMQDMYRLADERGVELDSISAMQNELGWPIYFAKGSERNIKLTRVEDIELFKALLLTKKDAWLK